MPQHYQITNHLKREGRAVNTKFPKKCGRNANYSAQGNESPNETHRLDQRNHLGTKEMGNTSDINLQRKRLPVVLLDSLALFS